MRSRLAYTTLFVFVLNLAVGGRLRPCGRSDLMALLSLETCGVDDNSRHKLVNIR